MTEKKKTNIERLAVIETKVESIEASIKGLNKWFLGIVIVILVTNADKIPMLFQAFGGTALAGN